MVVLTKAALVEQAVLFTEQSPCNRVSADEALRPDLAGMRIFDAPEAAVASADDPMFEALRKPGVVGPRFRPPRDWLPCAKSVVSFFLPFTDVVKKANRADAAWPAPEWLHGRIEGQMMIAALCRRLEEFLTEAGCRAVAPSLNAGFKTWRTVDRHNAPFSGDAETAVFGSNWSERHVAYVCGLGTFGLSAGLITKRGMAGRFGSVLTDLELPPDTREYAAYDAYCTRCGACVRRCPAKAVSPETGKDHALCAAFLDKTLAAHKPRYGCGKCQTRVPCESAVPPAERRREKRQGEFLVG
jgi:epoxyqueuosine reductase QueG